MLLHVAMPRQLGKGMGLTAPRAKRADGSSRWEVDRASLGVCSGFSNSRAFPNWHNSNTEAPDGRFGWQLFLISKSQNVPGHLTG